MKNENLQNIVSQKHYVKKALSILLSLIMLFSITAGIDLSAFADTDVDWHYVILSDETASITGGGSSQTSLVIPTEIEGYKVISIGSNAFQGRSNLKSVTIPDSVEIIEEGAFSDCTNLTSIILSDSITIISRLTFSGCESITDIVIPNNVVSIDESAFSNCTSLINITIPDSVTSINRFAFLGCTSLTNLAISNTVESIGESAFEGCNSLTDIKIPDSVTYIGSGAFSECSNLESMSVDENNKYYDSRNNCNAIIKTKSNNLICGCENTIIPDSVTSIGDYAFSNCTNLASITIPNSVTSIGEYAFSNCTNLKSVVIPDSVTIIGWCAFYGCTGLTDITIPDGGVISISGAFSNCTSLTDVTIPKGVISILGAFSNCTSLVNVTIPNSVVNIHTAFYACTSLVSVTIPNSVTSIDNSAFASCKSLTNITIPNSVTSIGENAFEHCVSLENITIPTSVKNIDNYAFYGCTGLTSVTLPNSIISIGESAFLDCTNLTNITIPKSITEIGRYAFAECYALSDVYYDGTIDEWNQIFNGFYNESLAVATIHCVDGVINCKHNYDDGSITQAPTCTQNGVKTYTCMICGVTKTEVVDRIAHTYNAGKVTKAATCTVDGIKTYSCTGEDCVAIKTEIIPATGHKAVTDKAVTATCTSTGLTEGSHCSVCGTVITAQKTVAATGHTYDAGKVTKAATCTASGVKTYTCTSCGETKTETIKATGHSYKTTVTKATTSKNGSSVTKCTRCGNVSKKSTIAYPKTVTLSATSYTYDGKAKKPTVTVKDNAGKTVAASNYTVAYSNNTNVGTATVKVTFKGNYSGSISKTFKINPKNTSISSVSALYKGFTVKYVKQATQTTGYQIQYSTNSNFKDAKTVTINKNTTVVKNVTGLTAKKKYYIRIRTYKTVGKTNYYSAWSGSKNVTTSSYPTSISLSSTSYTYDGKVKKPSVTVKHGSTKIASKYYTVSYSSGRKNVGTYTVTIKFKAPYSGTVKKTFKINPKNTSISSLSAQSKAFTVKLKKYTTQTTGYQIQYSTSSNFSNAKTVTVKNSTTSKKVTGLTGNKKYYVRIRTYKTVGKTNYYSGWTKAKTVTTKK